MILTIFNFLDIKNGPYKNHNLNRIAVLLEELSWQTGKFLPKTAQKLVNKNYFNFGLATKSAAILQKLMIDQGCTHEAGYCVATGTWKMSKKFGHHTIYSLPYDRFLENGKPVFENLNDKAKAAYATYLDYEKDRFGCKCHI
uniref:Uncharacterized protein n=1 Tax=Panagrolaimus davidi TaxID=227884 RepID=A0A914PD22_9BILA